MTTIAYHNYLPSVREELVEAQRHCWENLSAPGCWLDGSDRVNVAAEVRNARGCPLCVEQKDAISPTAVNGTHTSLGDLDDNEVEMIHRIVSDPGRLSKVWYKQKISSGLSEERYIEITGIVAMVMVIDTFTCALGINDHPLPRPQSGTPSYYRSPGARTGAAWIPIVEPEDASDTDGDLYPNPKVGYIVRALSALPEIKKQYWSLMDAHYLPGPLIYLYDRDHRAISRPQMEVIAGRVSALHQCLY